MMQNNNWTRPEDKVTAEEYLEKLGLTQALDCFLLTPDMHDLYHTMFTGGCDGLKAVIESMPESVRGLLLEDVEGCEEAEGFFIHASIQEFKEHMATLLYANEYTLGDVSGVVMCYKTALENADKNLENLAMELAGELLDEIVESYKKTWLVHLRDVEDHEGKTAILKAALGDKIPNVEHCVVVEVDASRLMDDEEEGDTK